MKTTIGAILLLMTVGAGCGPQVNTLLRDRHYNEAVCAGAESSRSTRRRVTSTLARQSGVQLHVEEVSQLELRKTLGAVAPTLSRRAHLLRVRAQSNALPLDDLALDASVVDVHGRSGAAPVSWRSLAWLTGERLPGRRRRQTYWHAGNFLKALLLIPTAGLLLPMTRFTKAELLVDAPHADYVRLAPRATALQRLMRRRGCHPLTLPDPRRATPSSGVRCVWYFVAQRNSAAHWHLRLHYRFTARRIGRDLRHRDKRCVLRHVQRVDLGRSPVLSQRLSERFGKRYRRVVREPTSVR